MKTTLLGACAALVIFCFTANICVAKDSLKVGEEKFKALCSVCHPDGGNIMHPEKTLHKKDREENNVKTAGDIVGKMRNPGPGMTKFDKKTVSDKDAHAIAEYILKTF